MKHNPFQDIIRGILRKNDKARDNDLLLFLIVTDRMGWPPERMTILDAVTEMKLGNLPTMDTVTRLRREIQEKDINLRGKRYADRKDRAEAKIRERREKRSSSVTVLT